MRAAPCLFSPKTTMNNKTTHRIRTAITVALASLGLLSCTAFAGISVDAPMPFPPDTRAIVDNDDVHKPELIKSVAPVHPAELAGSDFEERVYVVFVVDTQGKVKNAKGVLGKHPQFESAAVEAVQKWEFKPGVHDGHVVNTQMYVAIIFGADKK